ncbi:MAG: YifB family Mg chelatase-like AAA ATPase [Bacteroidales bacterium]|jgi:magnesium chelatase family protein|nr:YifB family Mg chelatase-like AAA ATPase [Bacteroidales bacterium]MCI2121568.1 YifB family Mg chelatase-like AAA ATPase [Bacteroidales bacterium]MCI2145081.1 YifB family Mg chelatase-like AAA ATPase [Bacteroidales bacterium]
MESKTFCATMLGLEVVTVTVEVDISVGIGIHLVGLPDSAVRESLLRVGTALQTYGFRMPGRKIVVNLAPADIRKEGSSFDLAIAIGIMASSGQAYVPLKERFIIMGELALNGEIRPVTGALPVAIHALEKGFAGCIFPYGSAFEAREIDGIEIYAVGKLADVLDILDDNVDSSRYLVCNCDPAGGPGPGSFPSPDGNHCRRAAAPDRHDFREVRGQAAAKRGLEIAAAGGHNLLMVGSPGSGKSMMAACIPSILPPMSREESLETSKIYSIAGKSAGTGGLMRERPFRTPHHTASTVALIGGGSNAMPGEISLAHNGVLYLDEMAEFPRSSLEVLRQPLEDGKITISRSRYRITYPASFMLIASMNPCPCGYFGVDDRCRCTPAERMRYFARISGPMMDRIDMHIMVHPVESARLVDDTESEPSSAIASRVAKARAVQRERFGEEGIFTNSQMDAALIRKYCPLDAVKRKYLEDIIRKLRLSARSYGRILKLSRTIADLDGANFISLEHISEAVRFREMDRNDKIYG